MVACSSLLDGDKLNLRVCKVDNMISLMDVRGFSSRSGCPTVNDSGSWRSRWTGCGDR